MINFRPLLIISDSEHDLFSSSLRLVDPHTICLKASLFKEEMKLSFISFSFVGSPDFQLAVGSEMKWTNKKFTLKDYSMESMVFLLMWIGEKTKSLNFQLNSKNFQRLKKLETTIKKEKTISDENYHLAKTILTQEIKKNPTEKKKISELGIEISPLNRELFLNHEKYLDADFFDESFGHFMVELKNNEAKFIYVQLLREKRQERLQKDSLKSTLDYQDLLEWLLQKLPFPVCVFNDFGDILWQSKEFSQLSILPKDILSVDNRGQIDWRNKSYQVFNHSFALDEQSLHAYWLSEVKTPYGAERENTDLGIMTSSIAHELNNPIAGILAALEVFQLMKSSMDPELVKGLDNIKSSASRCRDLVKTFLGFTRADIRKHSQVYLSVESIFQQSVSLARSRLIETDVTWDWHFNQTDPFSQVENESVFVMIFYLILSELVTYYSRDSLIKVTDLKTIYGEVLVKKNSIEISVRDAHKIYDKLTLSTLFKHLLDLENLDFSSTPTQMRLVKTK
jgi:signal transduction histidine kinase